MPVKVVDLESLDAMADDRGDFLQHLYLRHGTFNCNLQAESRANRVEQFVRREPVLCFERVLCHPWALVVVCGGGETVAALAKMGNGVRSPAGLAIQHPLL
jgi:hypothetical protein